MGQFYSWVINQTHILPLLQGLCGVHAGEALVDGRGGVDCSAQSHQMVHCTHDPSKNSALQCGTRSDASDAFCIERHGESCSASGADKLASLDALWLLLATGDRRCSASAVRLSARREPGQRGHEALLASICVSFVNTSFTDIGEFLHSPAKSYFLHGFKIF